MNSLSYSCLGFFYITVLHFLQHELPFLFFALLIGVKVIQLVISYRQIPHEDVQPVEDVIVNSKHRSYLGTLLGSVFHTTKQTCEMEP